MSAETLISVPFYGDLIVCVLHGSPFPDTQRAQRLLLGTCAQESHFIYTQQIGGGPALGLMQIEQATEASLWGDYLAYHGKIADYLTSRCGRGGPDATALEYDMVYGILLARVLYFWRDPDPLPDVDDVEEQAHRYKIYYNTVYGAATEQQYLENYSLYVAPHYPPFSSRRA
jgi:hypothetical protein